MYTYFGILICIALNPVKDLEEYWSRTRSHFEFIVEAMACNWFEDIAQAFTVLDPRLKLSESQRVLYNCSYFLVYKFLTNSQLDSLKDCIQAAFMKYWILGRDVIVDECILVLQADHQLFWRFLQSLSRKATKAEFWPKMAMFLDGFGMQKRRAQLAFREPETAWKQ